MTSKTTMVLEINELKAKLKAKDEEFIKILESILNMFETKDFYQDIISEIEEIKQRIKEE